MPTPIVSASFARQALPTPIVPALFARQAVPTPIVSASFARQALLSRSRRFLASSKRNPYIVLGLDRTASQDTIRERYLQLARSHHPDIVKTAGTSFSQMSEAYQQLRTPEQRADTDLALDEELRDPEEWSSRLAMDAVSHCKAGQMQEGLSLIVRVLGAPAAYPAVVRAASTVLELAAKRGEPHHRQTLRIWSALRDWDAVDAKACNAFFTLAMRSGHVAIALQAARYAEDNGLELSAYMASTLRQIRRYKKASRSDGDVTS
jgi:curved DNA-binding protein CbpA